MSKSHTGSQIVGAKKKPASCEPQCFGRCTMLAAALSRIPCFGCRPVIDYSCPGHQKLCRTTCLNLTLMSRQQFDRMVNDLETEIEVGKSHPQDEFCFVVAVPDYLQEPDSNWSANQLAVMQEISRVQQPAAFSVEMPLRLEHTQDDLHTVLNVPCIGFQWLTVTELKTYTGYANGMEDGPTMFGMLGFSAGSISSTTSPPAQPSSSP